jgi:asparagine synthase (glutamine-hydrolysing)
LCGISVIVKRPDYSVSVLEQFNAAIAHRGPDGDGVEYFDTSEGEAWRVGLAHRRLSILDLSAAGKQPMSYSNGDLWITFNGEIYNYIELKNQLKSEGYAFAGNSDTEVILAAYQAWGSSSFEKLRGMWGFVIYDRRKGLLIACRDRMGIKPLYYFIHENYIAFGSEIKQFLTLPEFVAKPDKSVVKQYILTGFERTDRTFFSGVLPLSPGTYTEVDIFSLKMGNPVSFWDPGKKASTITHSNEAAIGFEAALGESVRFHLRSDVPVGCQLSGGLDSSSVFSFMQEYYTGDRIHSFTVQFPGYQKDETPFVIRMLAGSNATSHFVTPAASVFREELRNFIWHHDEPVGSFSHYAGFVLARLIAQHQIKVVLNGQGGDEILGGYWQQYFSYLWSLGKQGKPDKVFMHLLGALGAGGNEALFSQAPAMWRRFKSRNQQDQVTFTTSYANIPSLHFFGDYFSMADQERRIFEIRNLILPRLLKWDDRNLMAFGVEGRYPFLDHEVIETALSFDSSMLFKKGWTKYPLRMAMEKRLPKEISFRKSKWGFETPQQDWLRGALRPMLQDWVGSEKPIDQAVERSHTEAIANRFWKTGSLEDAQSLLRLFLLDQWFHVFSIRL